MSFPEYESFDALGLASLVKNKVMSPTELLNAAIERIETHNPKVNAVIHKLYDRARETANNLSLEGPFAGVPFLLKDLLADYAGTPINYGSRIAAGWVSHVDSEIVKRYKNAGLNILGKTNTPELGLSAVTEPELYGPTRNPWNLAVTTGGSSGGSAAAVASGMVPVAHGGDGGGSIRIPAAYCGLFGLKPTRGRSPTGPYVMRNWQGMVVEHVLTRSVRDSAAMLDVIAGSEVGSPIALPAPQRSFLSCLDEKPSKLKIAFAEQPFFATEVDVEYLAALKQTATLCENLGHDVTIAAPKFNREEVMFAFTIVVTADTAAYLRMFAEYSGRKKYLDKLETATAVACEMGKHFAADDFVWASQVLDMAGKEIAEFFQQYDVMLTPTMPVPPPVIGKFKPDIAEKYVLEMMRRVPYGPLLRKMFKQAARRQFGFTAFTPIYNITGQPAMSVPLYWDKQGLPIGMQFAARFGEDHLLLQLAAQLEQAQPWFDKRPK